MKKISIMIVLALMIAGCTSSPAEIAAEHTKVIAMDVCIKTGGVPILSVRDNTILKDCKYPPAGQ